MSQNDYAKAFDGIKWSFIHETLEAFGFSPKLIRWIKILYNKVSSCVMNNSYSSMLFPQTKRICKACPLSSFLFILTVEILAIELRKKL